MTPPKPLLWMAALLIWLASCVTAPAPTTFAPPSPTFTATINAPATRTPAAGATQAGPTAAAAPSTVRYTVRSGDTLLGIAQQHRVSMAAIQLANKMGESDVIRAGQALDIPAGPHWEGESPYWVVHVVRSGETVSGIARTFGLTTGDILRVNAIVDAGQIMAGQSLVIPIDSLRVAVTPTPPPQPAATRTRVAPTASLPPRTVTRTASPLPQTVTATARPTVAPPAIPSEVADWPATVVTLINQKRAAHGLPPYSSAPELMRAAQAHANDCSARGWCSHVGSDGADLKTRETRAGYTPKVWGENWVTALDPVKAVAWWYNETPPNDPHRRNLLHTLYDEVGIGIAPAGNGYYFIADFGNR